MGPATATGERAIFYKSWAKKSNERFPSLDPATFPPFFFEMYAKLMQIGGYTFPVFMV
jgi:hypothetical protein